MHRSYIFMLCFVLHRTTFKDNEIMLSFISVRFVASSNIKRAVKSFRRFTSQQGVCFLFLLWLCPCSPFSHCRLWEEEISNPPGREKTHWDTECCWLKAARLSLTWLGVIPFIVILFALASDEGQQPTRPTAATPEEISVLTLDCFSENRKGVYLGQKIQVNIPVRSFNSPVYSKKQDW